MIFWPSRLRPPSRVQTALLEVPRDEAERARFEAWCNEMTAWAAPRLGAGIVAALLLWWPLDRIVYAGQPESQRLLAEGRLWVSSLITLTVLLLPRFQVLRRHAVSTALAVILLGSGMATFTMARAGHSDPFWLAYFYICPVLSVALLQPLRARLPSALLIGAAVAGGFALAPGAMQQPAELRAAFSYLLFTSLLAAGLGHGLYLLIQNSFLMRLRVDEQRERLSELTARLEERVSEQTSELRQLHRQSQEAGAEQKRLLARDLHDGLGQELSSLRLLVGLGQTLSQEPAPRELFAELEGLVERVQISLRNVLQSLRPRLLDEQGLVEGLRTLLSDTERRWGLRCRLELGELPDPMPLPVSVAVFRICQEALHNVVRHAQASELLVRLQREGGELRLIVQDNGLGLGAPRPGGHGLDNVRERASELGGRAAWTEDGGTVLTVHIPLEKP